MRGALSKCFPMFIHDRHTVNFTFNLNGDVLDVEVTTWKAELMLTSMYQMTVVIVELHLFTAY